MEPELQHQVETVQPNAPTSVPDLTHNPLETLSPLESQPHALDRGGVDWLLIGPNGLRVGWSILLFATMYYLFRIVLETVFLTAGLIGVQSDYSAFSLLMGELILLFAMLGAMVVMAFVERRRVSDYHLGGPRSGLRFFSGAATGFAALSLLVALLAWGRWLGFSPASLSGVQALRFGALWAVVFLAVGLVEEGLFRCYVLSTLARGIGFWWALAAEIAICIYQFLQGGGNGAWGVYVIAALGLLPCLILHFRAAPRSHAFWQAAWVTSTVFASYHTSNNGENWIGVFAAGAIGFVFCVSVRLTGSAWWAIGCHAAWDWAETFFYGTADSGLVGQGHFLTASPAGNPLWSGGSDGPEGSLLVLAVILILLIALLAIYGRGKLHASNPPAAENAAA